jgi:hypothetical protein
MEIERKNRESRGGEVFSINEGKLEKNILSLSLSLSQARSDRERGDSEELDLNRE